MKQKKSLHVTIITFVTINFSIHLHISEKSSTFAVRTIQTVLSIMWRNSRVLLCFLAALLAGCGARKAPTLYGVEVEGTPFDLMERLVYDAPNECMPVEFLPMADGMYIFAILADGKEVVIYCETDK